MISVIICTHNPRADYLCRTLDGLRSQTLPVHAWELIVVDNASLEPLTSRLDLAWHPMARVLAEPETGLTPARLRGIAEARGDLLVWVDDDNILEPDYLDVAAKLHREWPRLGVWGCGHYTPEWEETPAAGLGPYLEYLAVQRAPQDRWSNLLYDYRATPAGAGLCTRSAVARRYAENVRSDPRRKVLGRTGTGLGGCEDHDLAFTAIDLGYGTGVFISLRLIHLMPATRVKEDYLNRLVEGHAFSTVLLRAIRDPQFQLAPSRWIDRLRRWRLRQSLRPVERRVESARERGAARAWEMLRSRQRENLPPTAPSGS